MEVAYKYILLTHHFCLYTIFGYTSFLLTHHFCLLIIIVYTPFFLTHHFWLHIIFANTSFLVTHHFCIHTISAYTQFLFHIIFVYSSLFIFFKINVPFLFIFFEMYDLQKCIPLTAISFQNIQILCQHLMEELLPFVLILKHGCTIYSEKKKKIMNKEIIHLNDKDRYGLTSIQICEKMMTV